jgi:hypothetical protein
VSGGAWRDRSRRDLWPAQRRRAPSRPGRTVRLVVLSALVIVVVMVAAGSIVWLLEDQQGRDDIQGSVNDLPLVGRLVSDPETP